MLKRTRSPNSAQNRAAANELKAGDILLFRSLSMLGVMERSINVSAPTCWDHVAMLVSCKQVLHTPTTQKRKRCA